MDNNSVTQQNSFIMSVIAEAVPVTSSDRLGRNKRVSQCDHKVLTGLCQANQRKDHWI